MRDRLLIAKELLTETGSCFVQISDENVHLVRNVMDEVFGSENFVSQIPFNKTGGFSSTLIASIADHLLWYARDIKSAKYRPPYETKVAARDAGQYDWVELPNNTVRRMTDDELADLALLPVGSKVMAHQGIASQGVGLTPPEPINFEGHVYTCPANSHWKTTETGIKKLIEKNRLFRLGNSLRYKRYLTDFPVLPINNVWLDVGVSGFGEKKKFVVQTNPKVIQRCMLMATDPGDLVLDPTCGGGTTAYVAEQFGRRWITTDTSRIALNIAKTRLTTATFPFYKLYDEAGRDIRQGFVYKTVPHVTLKSLANDEPPATETLFDKPEVDKNKLRVSGPFTVETLQNFEPVSPEEIAEENAISGESFEQVVKSHLLATGIKNGRKDEWVKFSRIEILSGEHLHARGYYKNGMPGEKMAYFHIGPKFGAVSKSAVTKAIVECRARGDASWLIILGFSFESDIEGGTITASFGNFEVTKARIHDDLLQEGLKKKPAKSAASFVTIGEPDIALISSPPYEGGVADASSDGVVLSPGTKVQVEVKGLDIYDPIKDEVKARDLHDIAYWMVDDNYDGSNFVVKQVFFCGGDKDEFAKWKKGLDSVAKDKTRLRAERTLKIEIDEEAFDQLYGYRSHPITIKADGQKIAVRVISQYGEESMKVLQS